MPPKAKGEVAAVLAHDTNPYGVFVNVEVPAVRLNFEQPTGEDGSPIATTLPTTHLSVIYPGPVPPLTGTPTQPGSVDTGLYEHGYAQQFRRDPGLDSLNALLNAPTTLCLHDSTTGALLASAPLDLTPFGLGQGSITLTDLLLDLAPQTAAAATTAAPEAPGGKPVAGSKPTTPQGGKKGAQAADAAPPAPPAAPTARLLGPPVLPSLTLHLTHRPAPDAGGDAGAATPPGGATAPGSRAPSKPTSPAPGADRSATPPLAAEAVPADPTTMLPEPLPYSFLPEEDLEGSNVITLEVVAGGPVPLPTGLLAANAAAPGKLTLSAALVLPEGAGAPLVLPGAPLAAAGEAAGGVAVAWPGGGRLRRVMTAAQVEALLAALDGAAPGESVLGVEVTRAVAEDKAVGDTQAAWDSYHAWAPLPGVAVLLEGGETAVPSAAAKESDDAVVEVPLMGWPAGRTSALPAFVPPAGKVKPVEEVAPGVAPAWQAAGSTLAVRLLFARPLVPPWTPPPPPEPTLQVLVPQRVLHPVHPPATADQELSSALTSLITSLAAAYQDHQAKQQLQGVTPQAGVPPEVAHKALIRDLNKSGRYLEWRDSLKAPLVRVVRDQMGKTGHMASAEMAGSLSALHAQLTGAAHAAIRAAGDDRPTPPPVPQPPPPPGELASLLSLAHEVEEVEGDLRRATALMQRRRLDKNNAQVHLDAALLACRSATAQGAPALTLASFALHCALEVDPSHAAALAATTALNTALLLAPPSAATTPALAASPALPLALAAGHALLDLDRSAPLPWALLHCAYAAAGQEQLAACCLQELKRQQREALSSAAAAAAAAAAATAGEGEGEGDALPAALQPRPPAALLLSSWQLAVQLGLAPLAARLMHLATTTFARTTAFEPVTAALLTARTTLLAARAAKPAQPAAPAPDTTPNPDTPQDADMPAADTSSAASQAPGALPTDPAVLLDMTAAAAKRARRLIKALPTTLTLDTLDLGPEATAQARLQLAPLLLLGEVQWAQAARAAAAAEAPAATRQAYLAQRTACRRAAQQARTEGRRSFQEALQLLVDQGWLGAQGAAPLTGAGGAAQAVGAAQALFGGASKGVGAGATEGEVRRGLLRLAVSYLEDEPLPECALDVATAAVALWPTSAACWSVAARAAAASPDVATSSSVAPAAWAQANLCDRWDGRAWEALALHEFRWGSYEDGVSALHQALALASSLEKDPETSLTVAPTDTLTLLQEAARRCTTVGNYSEAARHLKAALALSGGDKCFQVRHQLAGISACLGDSLAAREQAAAAFKLATTPLEQQQARELRNEMAVA